MFADAGCVFDVLVVESTSDIEENNRELSNFVSSFFCCFRTCSFTGDWGSRYSGSHCSFNPDRSNFTCGFVKKM